MRTHPSSRVRIFAPGVGEVEASLIVEEGTELIVMLRDAEAFVESHLRIEKGVGEGSSSRPLEVESCPAFPAQLWAGFV